MHLAEYTAKHNYVKVLKAPASHATYTVSNIATFQSLYIAWEYGYSLMVHIVSEMLVNSEKSEKCSHKKKQDPSRRCSYNYATELAVSIHWTGLLDWATGLTQNGVKCLFQPFSM